MNVDGRSDGMRFQDPTPIAAAQRFSELVNLIKKEYRYRSDVQDVHVDRKLKRIHIVYTDNRVATLTVQVERS